MRDSPQRTRSREENKGEEKKKSLPRKAVATQAVKAMAA
jgi:hypothetical protein